MPDICHGLPRHGGCDDAWVDYRSPSSRLWSARQLLWALVVVPVTTGLTVLFGLTVGTLAAVIVLVVCLVLATVEWVLLRGRFRSWGYAEREDDLLIRRGFVVRRLSVVPYGRMQFVDVTAGPVERIFGLATVKLHTAAAATDAKVPGLLTAEAERLRDRLASLGEAQASGL
jgi:membrane protein YdbS with pleckstrin-like domain